MQYNNNFQGQGGGNDGQMGGQNAQGGPQMGDVFNKGNADMLMNYGLSQGQNILKTQGDKWMPQVSG
jgi:hypothetical protein